MAAKIAKEKICPSDDYRELTSRLPEAKIKLQATGVFAG